MYGSGDAPMPVTSVHDIAAWLPKVVLDPTAAEDTHLFGNVASFNDIVATYSEITGVLAGLSPSLSADMFSMASHGPVKPPICSDSCHCPTALLSEALAT